MATDDGSEVIRMMRVGMQVIHDQGNEDYNFCLPRNEELSGLAIGVTMTNHPTFTKEAIVAAYLLGRADGLAAADEVKNVTG